MPVEYSHPNFSALRLCISYVPMQCRILGGGIFRSALNCPKRCSQLSKYSFSGAALKSLHCISHMIYDRTSDKNKAVKKVFVGIYITPNTKITKYKVVSALPFPLKGWECWLCFYF